MRRVDAQIALVTGGASGLGAAIAERLATDGARVVITDVQTQLGERTAAQGGFTFIEHDVCDEGRWSEVVREIEARFGRLDIVVNNAGILGPAASASVESIALSDWRRIFAVNVEGTLLGCRAAISAMRRTGGGVIINIASVAGLLAAPHAPAYGASKATVAHLTRTVAQHCAQHRLRIRCNAVFPGVVRTALWERHAEEQARQRDVSLEHIVAETKAGIPLGELTRPRDIAAAVSFLASEDARQVTGAELVVDGGLVSCDTYTMSRAASLATPVVSSSAGSCS
jgi:3(or 17)beta-hydroxysteroid dehydrogenase